MSMPECEKMNAATEGVTVLSKRGIAKGEGYVFQTTVSHSGCLDVAFQIEVTSVEIR